MRLTEQQIIDLANTLKDDVDKNVYKHGWLQAIAAMRILAVDSSYDPDKMLDNLRHYIQIISLMDLAAKIGCLVHQNNKNMQISVNSDCTMLLIESGEKRMWIGIAHLKTLVDFMRQQRQENTADFFLVDHEKFKIYYNKNKATLVRENAPQVSEYLREIFAQSIDLFKGGLDKDEDVYIEMNGHASAESLIPYLASARQLKQKCRL